MRKVEELSKRSLDSLERLGSTAKKSSSDSVLLTNSKLLPLPIVPRHAKPKPAYRDEPSDTFLKVARIFELDHHSNAV
jgi:hypothetical protein